MTSRTQSDGGTGIASLENTPHAGEFERSGAFIANLAASPDIEALDEVSRAQFALELLAALRRKDPHVVRAAMTGVFNNSLSELQRESRRVLAGLLNGERVTLPAVQMPQVTAHLYPSPLPGHQAVAYEIDNTVVRDDAIRLFRSMLDGAFGAVFPFLRCERCGVIAWKGTDSRVRYCSPKCAGAARGERHRLRTTRRKQTKQR